MNAIDKAKKLLDGGKTLAVVGKATLVFEGKGIKDLYSLSKEQLCGAAVADKIVGRAAVLLLADGGAAEVYAATLSEGGKKVLEDRGIAYAYGTLTKEIVNRAGDGPCPMEVLSRGVENGEELREKIKAWFEEKERRSI